MDVFMYLSATEPQVDQLSTVPLRRRLTEALRYENFTVKVLFENIPKLDPHFPPNCTSDLSVDQPGHKVPRYYQQLFGLTNCFALVRDYETKHNIKYELMVRTRADIEFLRIPDTFDRPSPFDINTTMILPPNRYSSVVDDGFAVGPMSAVEVYMNRYYSFQECITRDLHPERYLHFYLKHRNVAVVVDSKTLVGHIPHAPNRCHWSRTSMSRRSSQISIVQGKCSRLSIELEQLIDEYWTFILGCDEKSSFICFSVSLWFFLSRFLSRYMSFIQWIEYNEIWKVRLLLFSFQACFCCSSS